jgi:hypothetical protein
LPLDMEEKRGSMDDLIRGFILDPIHYKYSMVHVVSRAKWQQGDGVAMVMKVTVRDVGWHGPSMSLSTHIKVAFGELHSSQYFSRKLES